MKILTWSLIFQSLVVETFLQTTHKDCLEVLWLLLVGFWRPSHLAGQEHSCLGFIRGIPIFNVAGHGLTTLDSSLESRLLMKKLGFNLPVYPYSTNWSQAPTQVPLLLKLCRFARFPAKLYFGVCMCVLGGVGDGYSLIPFILVKTLGTLKIKFCLNSCWPLFPPTEGLDSLQSWKSLFTDFVAII